MNRNKETTDRLLVTLLIIGIVLAVAVGCDNSNNKHTGSVNGANDINNGVNAVAIDRIAVVEESYLLPSDLGDIRQIAHHDDMLYYTAVSYNGGSGNDDTFTVCIYSQDIDGTGFNQMTNYVPPLLRPDGVNGGVHINALHVDDDGNLWTVEEVDFYTGILPDDFDILTDSALSYIESIASGNYVRKLDNTGSELLSVDMSSFPGLSTDSFIRAVTTDASGYIYMIASNWKAGKQELLVIDNNGRLLLQREIEGFFDIRFLRMPDGSIAFTYEMLYEDNIWYQVLQTIDNQNDVSAELIKIPVPVLEDYNSLNTSGLQLFAGGRTDYADGEFDILVNNRQNAYGYVFESNIRQPARGIELFNWLDLGISGGDVERIAELSTGRYICINRVWDNTEFQNFMIYFIQLLLPSELLEETEVIEITVAMLFNDGSLSFDIIPAFNAANNHYRIKIKTYAESQNPSSDELNAARERLAIDLIAGNIPDMLYMRNLPYAEYANNGWFEDLYPYIDSDTMFDRVDFADVSFRAVEIDGKLYMAPRRFQLNALLGHPSIVGTDIGWNMDEFLAVLDNHPEADKPLGSLMTKNTFLLNAITVDASKYIDFETGAVHFDTVGFIQLLKISDIFPLERGENDTIDAIAAGNQIMLHAPRLDAYGYSQVKKHFGGEVAIKGFPSDDRTGPVVVIPDGLAILSGSPHKDAAWDFLRMTLSNEWQEMQGLWGFPSNLTALRKFFQEATENELLDVDEADMVRIEAALNSASNIANGHFDHVTMDLLLNIISESSIDYFRGVITAEDAARIIQNRVSTLMSERN